MNYSLHITAAPYSNQSATTALLFATELLKQGHSLRRVFFSGEGVLTGNGLCIPPQDENNIQQAWFQLQQQHNLELIVCVAGALQRGIIDEKEAKRYQKEHFNLAQGFIISGLGQLVEANIESDRLICFK